VLTSRDGVTWQRLTSHGLEGPGPTRIAALATSRGRLVAVADRRRAAALRPSLLVADALPASGELTWEEVATIDGPGPEAAAATGLVAARGGLIVVGGTASDAMAWRTTIKGPGAPAVAPSAGTLRAVVQRAGALRAVADPVDKAAVLVRLRLPD
jgi:hypothetical protein